MIIAHPSTCVGSRGMGLMQSEEILQCIRHLSVIGCGLARARKVSRRMESAIPNLRIFQGWRMQSPNVPTASGVHDEQAYQRVACDALRGAHVTIARGGHPPTEACKS